MISSLNTIVSSKYAEMNDGKICDAIHGSTGLSWISILKNYHEDEHDKCRV